MLGAGTIGTELASSLIDRGCSVDLVDFAERPLERFLGGHLGAEAASWISARGASLHLGTRVEQIERHAREWVVSTSTGRLVGDVVVSAVGARPATQWLEGSGLDTVDGIRCDKHGTAFDLTGSRLLNIHAVGDVARWATREGEHRRYENWTAAGRQGRHLAQHLLGREAAPSDAEPAYFWSHQFGRRIQVLGTPEEDVPSSVELRWRPDDHQAAVLTFSS